MKVIALTRGPDGDIAGVAAPVPLGDPRAHNLTLWTSDEPDDFDAAWMLTQFLTSVAPVIAEEGWEAALSRFVPEDWRSPSACLVLLEDPLNLLSPGMAERSPVRRR